MNPRNLVAIVTFCSLVSVVVAGCSTESSRTLPPSQTISSPAPSLGNSDLPGAGAPNVERPLDTNKYLSDPCGALVPQQVLYFLGETVPGKAKVESLVGPECDWARLDGTGTGIHVTFSKTASGLTGIYSAQPSFFLPLEPINSYPIVAFGIGDDRPRGRCHTALGISNKAVIDVVFNAKRDEAGKADSCALAREVAGSIVLNIQGNQ